MAPPATIISRRSSSAFRSHPQDAQLAAIRRDIRAISENKMDHTYVFRSRSMDAHKMIAYFKKKWNPIYAEPHYLYMTNESDSKPITPNDRLYSKYQWNLPSIETERGWNLSKGSKAVPVAVLDTGVQGDHPDGLQAAEGNKHCAKRKPAR